MPLVQRLRLRRQLLASIGSGSIEFDGEDIAYFFRQAFRARCDIGMVLQNFEPFAPSTALARIMLAIFPQGGRDAGDPHGVPQGSRRSR